MSKTMYSMKNHAFFVKIQYIRKAPYLVLSSSFLFL
nr:MAG TPA: hypothetical protein [Caudoviricetes sp.]